MRTQFWARSLALAALVLGGRTEIVQAQNPPAFFIVKGDISNGDQFDPGFTYYGDTASGGVSASRSGPINLNWGTVSVSASIGAASTTATFQGSMDPVHASRRCGYYGCGWSPGLGSSYYSVISVYVRGDPGTKFHLVQTASGSLSASVTETNACSNNFGNAQAQAQWRGSPAVVATSEHGTGGYCGIPTPKSGTAIVSENHVVDGTSTGPTLTFNGQTYSYAYGIPTNLELGIYAEQDPDFTAHSAGSVRVGISANLVVPGQTPPTAVIAPLGTVAVSAPVTLDGSGSHDPDGTIIEYRWEVQNTSGGIIDVFRGPQFPYAQIPYTWSAPGTYQLTLVVTDNEGLTGTASTSVVVSSVVDSDGDGVPNGGDHCSDTPPGEPVDANGCSAKQADDDLDGVCNPGVSSSWCTGSDNCPGSPYGRPVDATGCTSCSVPVRRMSQSDHRWNPPSYPASYVTMFGLLSPPSPSQFRPYAYSTVDTIQNKGCALTSLAMDLDYEGVSVIGFQIPLIPPEFAPRLLVPTDPGSLNLFMIGNGGFVPAPENTVRYDVTTRKVGIALGTAKFRFDGRDWGSQSEEKLEDTVCSGHPVVVGVVGSSGRFPGHFVLVTGAQSVLQGGVVRRRFSIADPDHFSVPNYYGVVNPSHLDDYDSKFVIRGHVVDPASDMSGLDAAVGGNAKLLVVDQFGQRTGFDYSGENEFKEIPQSSYGVDSIEPDEGAEGLTGNSRSVNIFQAAAGRYDILVAGLELGPYRLLVNVFSEDGTEQPPLAIEGITAPGSTSTFQVQLDPSPGASSTIARLVTFESVLADIQNCLRLGLIDNAGIATSVSQKVRAADRAKGASRVNILNAFKNELKAQAGKHIVGVAVGILVEDADSLIKQNP